MLTLNNSTPKARKEHQCNFCHQNIVPGEVYNKQTNICDGSMYVWKSHTRCTAIAKELQMYDDMEEGLSDEDFIGFINDAFYDLHLSTLPVEKTTFTQRLDVVCKFHLNKEDQ
tara:strand:- start:2775 stop:3113 length:339 start_codon:yes stop_codon:yes gene_type:complete